MSEPRDTTEPREHTLKPCPFCGAVAANVVDSCGLFDTAGRPVREVRCRCGVRGPTGFEDEQAIRFWNRERGWASDQEHREYTDTERLGWLLEALKLADIDSDSLDKWMGQGEAESRSWPDRAWIDAWLDSRLREEEPRDE